MRPYIKNKFKLLSVVTALTIQAAIPSTSKAQTNDRVHFGFIYPISTHGTNAALDTNDLSFHVLAGVSAAEKGLAFAGLSNIVRYEMKGMAVAGFSNHIGKKSEGLLIAGFVILTAVEKGCSLQASGMSQAKVLKAVNMPVSSIHQKI